MNHGRCTDDVYVPTMSFCKVWRMRMLQYLPGSLFFHSPPPPRREPGDEASSYVTGNSIIIDRLKFTSEIFYRRKYADLRYNQTPVPQEQEGL